MENKENTSLLSDKKPEKSSPPTSDIGNQHGSGDLSDIGRANERTLDHIFDEIGFGWYQQRLFLMVGVSFSCDSIELALLPFIQGCVKQQFNISTYAESLLTSVVFAGEVLGMLVLCPMADVYGRRPIILLGFFFVIVFGLASCLSPNIYYLIVFRSLVGVGIGAQQSVAYDLFTEMVPTKVRNRIIFISFFTVFGTEYIVGMGRLLLEAYGWRYLTLAAALPTVLLAFFGYFYIPESPRWLVSQGRYKEAEEILDNVAKLNEIDIGVINIKREVAEKEKNLSELLTGPFLNQTLLLWTIWIFSYFAMYCIFLSLLGFYSNGLCSFDFGYIALAVGVMFCGIVFATIFVNYSGRVNTQCIVYVAEAVFILLFGITYIYGTRVTATAMLLLAYAFTGGGLALLWLHTVELFPTEFRASGHCSCCIVGRFGSFAAVYWVDNYAAISGNELKGSYLYSLVILVAAFSVLSLPETTGTVLDELAVYPEHTKDDEESKEQNKNEEMESNPLLGNIRNRNTSSNSESHMKL